MTSPNYRKPPRQKPRFVENEEMLNKIRELVLDGNDTDRQLMRALHMSHDTWYRLKRDPNSVISATIELAMDDAASDGKQAIRAILKDSKHPQHFSAAKYTVDRHDKLNGHNKITVVHENLTELLTMPVDQLESQLRQSDTEELH